MTKVIDRDKYANDDLTQLKLDESYFVSELERNHFKVRKLSGRSSFFTVYGHHHSYVAQPISKSYSPNRPVPDDLALRVIREDVHSRSMHKPFSHSGKDHRSDRDK